MRTSVAVGAATACLVAVSILAVPAVASGADYLDEARAASSAIVSTSTVPGQNADISDAAAGPSRSGAGDLSPLITAWGVAGIALFGGGAIAVATSVRRQRQLTA